MNSSREYKDSRWIKLREEVLAKSPVCECCGEERATVVHHKIYTPFHPIWEVDPSWLESLCTDCHRRRTIKDRLWRMLPTREVLACERVEQLAFSFDYSSQSENLAA